MTDSVQAAVDFESAMADVAKVVDGLRDENGNLTDSYYAMSDSIVQMSKDIPMAAEDLAAITASAGTAGIAAEELTAFTETAAKMGVAFDTTADQAGDWMAKWQHLLQHGPGGSHGPGRPDQLPIEQQRIHSFRDFHHRDGGGAAGRRGRHLSRPDRPPSAPPW